MIQVKKFLNSFKYAFNGIKHCFRSENNFKVHTLAAIVVVVLGAWSKLSRWEWCILVFCIGLVLCCEIFNTAIEKLVDLVSPSYNDKAGKVKDIAAGAVLVAAIVSFIIGSIIFISHWELFDKL